MRAQLLCLISAGLVMASPLLAAAQTQQGQTQQGQAQGNAASATNSAAGDDRLLSPDQENRQGVVHGAMEAPLRDVNLIRSKIPPVLLVAMTDPYARPSPLNCVGIKAVVEVLDAVLGPDLDTTPTPEDPGLMARGKVEAHGVAVDALRGAAEGVIPFRSWVRTLSGASQHDRLVNAAITAGGVRRAYMKGLGESRGCLPPATPRHLAHPLPMPIDGPRKPEYPIH